MARGTPRGPARRHPTEGRQRTRPGAPQPTQIGDQARDEAEAWPAVTHLDLLAAAERLELWRDPTGCVHWRGQDVIDGVDNLAAIGLLRGISDSHGNDLWVPTEAGAAQLIEADRRACRWWAVASWFGWATKTALVGVVSLTVGLLPVPGVVGPAFLVGVLAAGVLAAAGTFADRMAIEYGYLDNRALDGPR